MTVGRKSKPQSIFRKIVPGKVCSFNFVKRLPCVKQIPGDVFGTLGRVLLTSFGRLHGVQYSSTGPLTWNLSRYVYYGQVKLSDETSRVPAPLRWHYWSPLMWMLDSELDNLQKDFHTSGCCLGLLNSGWLKAELSTTSVPLIKGTTLIFHL